MPLRNGGPGFGCGPVEHAEALLTRGGQRLLGFSNTQNRERPSAASSANDPRYMAQAPTGLKPLERRVVRRRPGLVGSRLGLELDAAVLPVRDVVTAVQELGLQVRRVRLRPISQSNRQQVDLDYGGEAAPEAFVELLERLQALPGVHRLTTAVAAARSASNNSVQ
jgi:hypothetical protein